MLPCNSFLIRTLEHQRTRLSGLVGLLDKVFAMQVAEVNRCMFDMGKYRIVRSQSKLVLPDQLAWNRLTVEQKEKRVEKLFKGAKQIRNEVQREIVISTDGLFAVPAVSRGVKRKPGQSRGSGRQGRTRSRGALSRSGGIPDPRG